jgi:outer membrane protein assembly factor BamB/ribosomal protein L7/L12
MSEDIAKTLTCPACGAPLEYDGTQAAVRCTFCRNVSLVPGAPAVRSGVSEADLEEVRRLVAGGDLVEAIKRYRQASGVSLRQAQEAVQALRDRRWAEQAAAARSPAELTRALETVRGLLDQGRKVEAVKQYRQVFDVSLARAKYAVDQIEAGRTAAPEAGFPTAPAPAAESRPSPPDRAAGRVGCVIAAAVVLFFGGVLAFALSQPGAPLNPTYYANGPAVLVPSGSDGPPDVAALFYDPNAETRMIGLVDGQTGKLRWRAEPLPGDGYANALAHGSDLIYAASEADLFAYRRGDGSLAWQAPMTDRLNYDPGAMVVAGGRVITSNVDQSIQAYDAATGASAWSRRLNGYDRSLRLVGSALVVVDYTDDSSAYRLIFLDPKDGGQQRVIAPACQYSEHSTATVYPDSGLIFDEAANAVTLVYNSSPGCVQRLDLSSGRVIWQTLDGEDLDLSSGSPHALVEGDRLYCAVRGTLLAVDQSSGGLQTLLSDEDYEFVPLAASGETLIVRAQRKRGTSRFELWGIDRASGAQTWQVVLDGAEPVDPPDEMAGLIDNTDFGWTWRLIPSGLVVIKFQGDPNQIVLETIDPASGASLSQQTLRLGRVSGDFYSAPAVIGWQGSAAYISLETDIYLLDLAAGELTFLR